MEGEKKTESAISRPYFLPADLDFDGLPEPVQIAIQEILVPLYEDLVLGARNSLARSEGNSYVFLQLMEIQEQFAITSELDLRSGHEDKASAARNERVERYTRLVSTKAKVAGNMLRLEDARRRDPISPYFFQISAKEGPEIGKS